MNEAFLSKINNSKFWDDIWNHMPVTWTHDSNIDIHPIISILNRNEFEYKNEDEIIDFLTTISRSGLVEIKLLSQEASLFRRSNIKSSEDPALFNRCIEAVQNIYAE